MKSSREITIYFHSNETMLCGRQKYSVRIIPIIMVPEATMEKDDEISSHGINYAG